MSDSPLIVTQAHVFSIPGFSKRRGFCVPGVRLWCKQHGIDMRDAMRNGIPAERLESIGDAFALALVAWARECEAQEAPRG